nr:MAG TPA: hypothetical protein [Caudoviricetes sp.]
MKNLLKSPISPPKTTPFPIVYWDELKMNWFIYTMVRGGKTGEKRVMVELEV